MNIKMTLRWCPALYFPVKNAKIKKTHVKAYVGMFSWLLRLFQKENGDEGETRPTEKEEGILSHEKGRRKSFWRRHRSARNTSTQNSKMTKKRSKINELEELKLDMRKISNDMEEMCGILNLYMYEDLNYRMNTEFNIIKSQHEKTMLDMNKMIQSIIGSMQYSMELIEDNYSYSIKEDHLLRECTQLNENVRILLNENRRLMVEQAGHKCPVGKKRGSLRRPARTSVSQVPRNSRHEGPLQELSKADWNPGISFCSLGSLQEDSSWAFSSSSQPSLLHPR
eukprot:XP_017171803.1 PREDICTED: uncharacterized protein Gm3239 [Mus musculus]